MCVSTTLLIRKLRPFGARLPKMPPHIEQPKPAWNGWEGSESYFRSERSHLMGGSYTKPDEIPLRSEEYQWWVGSTVTGSCYASCRTCDHSIYLAHGNRTTLELRQRHLEQSDCRIRMKRAMRKLRNETHCLVCGKQTGQFHYGFKICGKTCLDIWKTNYPLLVRNKIMVASQPEKK